jgi:hypothetical protein
MTASQGKPIRKSIMYSFEEINSILDQMAQQGTIEPMVEPIDDPSVEVNFWDWADVVGAVDDFAPQSMVDEDGEVWYVS